MKYRDRNTEYFVMHNDRRKKTMNSKRIKIKECVKNAMTVIL